MAEKKPDATSSDYDAMKPYWDMVSTILDGADAMRAAREKYLPKFPNEADKDYDYRVKNAKFTNIYRDIVENLAAKPFSQEVGLVENSAPVRVEELAEDIDGQGNHLHVFAGSVFFDGINNGIDWLLVDYTKGVPQNATQAMEREMGARPYWVHVPAHRMLAVYSAVINGKEEFVHVRIHEPDKERDGYGEKKVNRVRIFNRAPLDGGQFGPATYEVWEEQAAVNQSGKEWVLIEGPFPVSIGIIPVVAFITGRRKEGSWQVIPPMKDAAFLQVEHFQQETALKSIKELTAFPMLAGNGVQAPTDAEGRPIAVPVGPRSVLYAPPNGEGEHGEWTFIETNAASLTFLASDIKETAKELRELGREPFTADSGNLTRIGAAKSAQKGNSAIMAWALNLKDALERALQLTCMWLKEDRQPEVEIPALKTLHVSMDEDKGPESLLKMRESGDLSQETLWAEMKRRNILAPEFDAKAEADKIIAEMPEGDEPEDTAAALGNAA